MRLGTTHLFIYLSCSLCKYRLQRIRQGHTLYTYLLSLLLLGTVYWSRHPVQRHISQKQNQYPVCRDFGQQIDASYRPRSSQCKTRFTHNSTSIQLYQLVFPTSVYFPRCTDTVPHKAHNQKLGLGRVASSAGHSSPIALSHSYLIARSFADVTVTTYHGCFYCHSGSDVPGDGQCEP
jgi:hypothetical protein